MDYTLLLFDPLILARGVHIAATLLAAGTVCFLAWVAEPALASAAGVNAELFRRRCRHLIWWALAVAIASGAAWLALVAAAILDKPAVEVALDGGIFTVAADTRFGTIWTVRLALALLLALLVAWQGGSWLKMAVAGALAALIAFTGHAGAKPGLAGDIYLVADFGHLVAASAWLGGLPALALLLAASRRHATWRVAAVIATARFSRMGMACVAVLLASGVIASVNLLGAPRDLIDTPYGRLLSLKIALFLGMVAVAAVNRFQLTPRLPRTDASAALVRNSFAELVLGLGIIAAVAALGTMVPGGHAAHHETNTIPDSAAFVHLHMPNVMADVTVDPGRVGQSGAVIRVMREDGSLYHAEDVKFALDPAGTQANSTPIAAKRAADGTWTVENLALDQSGVWTVRVIVGTGSTGPLVLDGPIVIEQQ